MRALWSAAIGETYGGYLIIGALASVLARLLVGALRPKTAATRLTAVPPTLSSRCLTGLYGVITLNQTLRWAVESASTAIAQPDGQ
jgi:hypothetical protein